MSLLCTFPGRYGDILWALPTVRALSARIGVPVDLAIAGEFANLADLLNLQPYIRDVHVLDHWNLTPPNEWKAPVDLKGTDWDECRDLGYRGWPDQPLPYFIGKQMGVGREELDLNRPWITIPPLPQSWGTSCVPVGFTEAWFELKVGLLHLLQRELEWTQEREDAGQPTTALMQMGVAGGRWQQAGWATYTWLENAEFITASNFFFGDCSALHVLAVACGKPVLIMEPMVARHNEIFYPFGMDGRVLVVKGNDGKPTFDARHCADVLRQKLRGE